MNIRPLVHELLEARQRISARRSVLVAVTGIDGCGKGHVTRRVVEALRAKGLRVAEINIDGWLNLPGKRFALADPAAHFYEHAIRFDEMFAQLVFPLRDRRSLCLEVDYTEETATSYRRHTYEFEAIDIVVLEGIYLLKRDFQEHYDVSCWIDCSFKTALERAISRAQEGLSPAETTHAYKTIYFPAQEIHFARDEPRAAATVIARNDSRPNPAGSLS